MRGLSERVVEHNHNQSLEVNAYESLRLAPYPPNYLPRKLHLIPGRRHERLNTLRWPFTRFLFPTRLDCPLVHTRSNVTLEPIFTRQLDLRSCIEWHHRLDAELAIILHFPLAANQSIRRHVRRACVPERPTWTWCDADASITWFKGGETADGFVHERSN